MVTLAIKYNTVAGYGPGYKFMFEENVALVTSSLKACIKAWQLSGCFWRRTINGGSIFTDDTELKNIYDYILSSHQVHFIMLVQKHTRTVHCFNKKTQRKCFHEEDYVIGNVPANLKWSVETFQRYQDETCSLPAVIFFIFLIAGYQLPCLKGIDASFLILI